MKGGCKMAVFKDLSGKVFVNWTVVEYYGKSKWKCECACGSKKIVQGVTLTKGMSKSCGCLKDHGMKGTKIHRLWSRMKERCFYEKHKSFKDYGGRGVTVCDEWKDFRCFYSWAKDNGYEEGLTLDRINVNGNYEPANCRFITNKEQQRNKRNNRFLTIHGIEKTVSEWGEISNLDRHTILYRINKGETGIYVLRAGRKGGGICERDFKKRFDICG